MESKLRTIALLLIGAVVGVVIFLCWIYLPSGQKEILSPVGDGYSFDVPTPTPTVNKALTPDKYWVGVASWYGAGATECLGCRKYFDGNTFYYVMANGQRLDDSKHTIAFNRLPLGTKVRIQNLDNNMMVDAVVSDTGGFEEPKYNKIADLTKAVRNALNASGNVRVKIWRIE